jgi:hypothetical protein
MSQYDMRDFPQGWPATAVIRLEPQRRLERRPEQAASAEKVLLAALEHPPRIGEVRPLGAILPQVLARYSANGSGMSGTSGSFDFASVAAED